MQYYREVYRHSKRASTLEDLNLERLIIYCEQGFGDILQFSRYFPSGSAKKIFLHCPVDLHLLFAGGIRATDLFWETGFELLDKTDPNLPDHDCHVLSLSIPFIINADKSCDLSHAAGFPYLRTTKTKDLSEFNGRTKIGICWEGSPNHFTNIARSVPLRFFKRIRENYPDCVFISLQREIHNSDLLMGCEDMELYGLELNDFADTAALINEVDFVVTVDTAVLHLAGALNKKTYLLLTVASDGRFGKGETTRWYPSVKVLRNSSLRPHELESLPNWEEVFQKVC